MKAIIRKSVVFISLIGLVSATGAAVFFFNFSKSQEELAAFQGIVEESFKEAVIRVWSKDIIFTGDIMLDRSVELQMKKHGFTYPFEKITELTKGYDIVFGNLEGPINRVAQEFPGDRMRFSFDIRTIEGLTLAGFNLLSLANNHTLNTNESGLAETREILKENSIDYLGHPISCLKESALEKQGIVFLGFNTTYPFNCSLEEILDAVKQTSQEMPDRFLIVSLHWGKEYEPTSSLWQRSLAHQMIDQGADLIIGHHPHVVQEIEEYQGRLIFYSLGNFVFDQYFSLETQQGLVVSLTIYPKKIIYHLYPVLSELSQPKVMSEPEAWLKDLAQKSSPALSEQIKAAEIILD